VQAWIYGILAGVAVLALMGIAYTIGSNSDDESAPTAAATTTAAEQPSDETGGGGAAAEPGEELFVSNCGSCHTLSAAGTSGATGPDLDTLAPDEAQVLAAIENGGAGSGAMPAGIVTGTDAEEVAAYVAEAAGGK
jgi:cytochrome c551